MGDYTSGSQNWKTRTIVQGIGMLNIYICMFWVGLLNWLFWMHEDLKIKKRIVLSNFVGIRQGMDLGMR